MYGRPKDLSKDPMDVYVVQENQLVLIDGFLFKVEYPPTSGVVGSVWKDCVYFTQVDPEGNAVLTGAVAPDYNNVHVRLFMPGNDSHDHCIASRHVWSDALNNKQGQRPCWEQFMSYEIR